MGKIEILRVWQVDERAERRPKSGFRQDCAEEQEVEGEEMETNDHDLIFKA